VNRGIIRAHKKGIVTSTSVVVDGLAASEAKNLLSYPELSVGLHFSLADEGLKAVLIKGVLLFSDIRAIEAEFNRQIEKFLKIVGRLPDHLDSHHHFHTHPKVKPIFEKFSGQLNCPVRAFKRVRFIRSFYGWNKLRQTDLKKISTESLLEILADLEEGTNEIMCHPGLVDGDLKRISRYTKEREIELKTLTDKRVIDYIRKSGIRLCSWREL
jgi:predicted glycoside hydrolase/deacetylase ChbG (UPF0249 family)